MQIYRALNCMETPCWCSSEGHKHGCRKVTETTVVQLLPRYAIFYCFYFPRATKVFHATSINIH